MTMPSCIRHDHVVVACQVSRQTRPAPTTIGDAVQQEHRGFVLVACAVVVNGDVIALHIAFRPCYHLILLFSFHLHTSLSGRRFPSPSVLLVTLSSLTQAQFLVKEIM